MDKSDKTFTTSPTQDELKPNELERHLAETLFLEAERGPAPKERDYLSGDYR